MGGDRPAPLKLLNTKRAWLDQASSPRLEEAEQTPEAHLVQRQRHLTVVVVGLHALRGKRARADGSLIGAGNPKK